MTEILQLINNLDVVDLLDPDSIYLTSWELSLPPRRDTIHTPIYDNGSTLLSSQFDNLVETMTIAIVGSSHNNVITNLRNLTSILEAAKSHYIGLKSTPTYLAAKTNAETGTRYAVVKNYKLEKLSQALGLSTLRTGVKILGKAYTSGFPQVVLVLELDLWQSEIPGATSPILVAGYQEFNDTIYGSVNSSSEITPASLAYLANKGTVANISHVYRYDASAATYTALHSLTPPFDLLPNPLGNGDILYLGSSISITNSGPFSNAIFDVGVATDANMPTAWEYFNGATWEDLGDFGPNVVDGTSEFRNTGINSVSWGQPIDWSPNDPGMGVSAYWVRFRVLTTGGATITPTQQNRKIYSATWNYVEIDSDQLPGDIPNIVKYVISQWGRGEDDDGALYRIFMGLRSVSRGEDFSSIWNASNEQQPTGVSFSGPAINANALYPTGRIANETVITSSGNSMGLWTVGESYSAQYLGRFRVFLSFIPSATSGSPEPEDLSFYLQVMPPFSFLEFYTDRVSPYDIDTSKNMYVDLGEISIQERAFGELSASPLQIELFGITSSGMTVTARPVQLVLLPCDEWSCSIENLNPPGTTGLTLINFDSLEVNGTKNKDMIATTRRYISSNEILGIPFYNSTSIPVLQSNAKQRLHMIFSAANWVASSWPILRVSCHAVSRYLALRGSD